MADAARAGLPRLLPALALAGVLALALALRLAGTGWGLPFIYDPDEPDFVARAFRMLEAGDANPHWFGHPGTTTMYLNALAYAAWGALDGMAAVAERFATDPAPFYRIARVLVALAGWATVAVVARLARRVAGAGYALLAAGLLAVSPLTLQYAWLARPDLLMALLATAATLWATGIATRGAWRDYLAAGFLLGLAVATKYPAAIFALVIAAAHVLRQSAAGAPPWRHASRLAGAAAAVLAGVALGSPFLLLDWTVAVADVARESRSYHLSGTSAGFWPTLAWYAAGPLRFSLGLAGLALAAAGAWRALRRREAPALLVLLAPLAFVVAMSGLSLRWDRWILPAVPFLCVLAALGLREAAELAARLRGPAAARVAASLLAVAALAGPARDGWLEVRGITGGETRTLAWRWIIDHVPPGSSVLVEAYTPQLPAGLYRVFEVEGGGLWPAAPGRRLYVVPRGIVGTLADPGLVGRAGIDYVVLANHYDRRLAEAARYPRELAVYQALMARHELVYEALPGRGVATGLPVRVYRVR